MAMNSKSAGPSLYLQWRCTNTPMPLGVLTFRVLVPQTRLHVVENLCLRHSMNIQASQKLACQTQSGWRHEVIGPPRGSVAGEDPRCAARKASEVTLTSWTCAGSFQRTPSSFDTSPRIFMADCHPFATYGDQQLLTNAPSQ